MGDAINIVHGQKLNEYHTLARTGSEWPKGISRSSIVTRMTSATIADTLKSGVVILNEDKFFAAKIGFLLGIPSARSKKSATISCRKPNIKPNWYLYFITSSSSGVCPESNWSLYFVSNDQNPYSIHTSATTGLERLIRNSQECSTIAKICIVLGTFYEFIGTHGQKFYEPPSFRPFLKPTGAFTKMGQNVALPKPRVVSAKPYSEPHLWSSSRNFNEVKYALQHSKDDKSRVLFDKPIVWPVTQLVPTMDQMLTGPGI